MVVSHPSHDCTKKRKKNKKRNRRGAFIESPPFLFKLHSFISIVLPYSAKWIFRLSYGANNIIISTVTY